MGGRQRASESRKYVLTEDRYFMWVKLYANYFHLTRHTRVEVTRLHTKTFSTYSIAENNLFSNFPILLKFELVPVKSWLDQKCF